MFVSVYFSFFENDLLWLTLNGSENIIFELLVHFFGKIIDLSWFKWLDGFLEFSDVFETISIWFEYLVLLRQMILWFYMHDFVLCIVIHFILSGLSFKGIWLFFISPWLHLIDYKIADKLRHACFTTIIW